METEAYAASSGERKKIEALFGEAKQIPLDGKAQTEGLDRRQGRVPPDRDRPEPEKARQSNRETTATDHDGLIHAQSHPARPITQNRLSSSLRRKRKNVRYFYKRTSELRSDPTSSNSLSQQRTCPRLCRYLPLIIAL